MKNISNSSYYSPRSTIKPTKIDVQTVSVQVNVIKEKLLYYIKEYSGAKSLEELFLQAKVFEQRLKQVFTRIDERLKRLGRESGGNKSSGHLIRNFNTKNDSDNIQTLKNKISLLKSQKTQYHIEKNKLIQEITFLETIYRKKLISVFKKSRVPQPTPRLAEKVQAHKSNYTENIVVVLICLILTLFIGYLCNKLQYLYKVY
jgi:hypothetical protein